VAILGPKGVNKPRFDYALPDHWQMLPMAQQAQRDMLLWGHSFS